MRNFLTLTILAIALSTEAALSPPYLVPIGTNTAGSWFITKPGTNRISNYEGWETFNTNMLWLTNHIGTTSNSIVTGGILGMSSLSAAAISAINNLALTAAENATNALWQSTTNLVGVTSNSLAADIAEMSGGRVTAATATNIAAYQANLVGANDTNHVQVSTNALWQSTTNLVGVSSNSLQGQIDALPTGISMADVRNQGMLTNNNAGVATFQGHVVAGNSAAFYGNGVGLTNIQSATDSLNSTITPSDTSGLLVISAGSNGAQPLSVNTTNLTWDGSTVTAGGFTTKDGGVFTGRGSGLTNLDATKLSGVVPLASIPLALTARSSVEATNITPQKFHGLKVVNDTNLADSVTTMINSAAANNAEDATNKLEARLRAELAVKTNTTIYDNILFAKTDSASYWWATNDTSKQQLRFLGEAGAEPLALDWSDGAGYGAHTPNLYATAAYVGVTNAAYVGTDGNGKIVSKSAPTVASMWEFHVTATTTDDTPKAIYTNSWPTNGRRFVKWQIQATSDDYYLADAGYTVFNRTNGCDTPSGVRMGITGYAVGAEQVSINTNNAGCVWTVTGSAGVTYTWKLVGYSDGYWDSQ